MPGCSGEKEGVVGDVVDHSGIGSRHGVYRREDGGENSKNIARKSITGQQAELDVLKRGATQYRRRVITSGRFSQS